jgi:glycine cleavage system transcriptional repressor
VSLLAVTVLGHDRPGIIADTTEVLARLGGNLEDSSMTLLRGHFAMTLLVSGSLSPEDVEAALADVTAGGGLLATVWEVVDEPDPPTPTGSYVLTVHGADRPGIVSSVTRVVADTGGNITDLTTRLVGDLYLLVAEVDLPVGVDAAALAERLAATARSLGVEASLRPAEPDVL